MLLQFVQHPEDAVAFDLFGLGEGSKAGVACKEHMTTGLRQRESERVRQREPTLPNAITLGQ